VAVEDLEAAAVDRRLERAALGSETSPGPEAGDNGAVSATVIDLRGRTVAGHDHADHPVARSRGGSAPLVIELRAVDRSDGGQVHAEVGLAYLAVKRALDILVSALTIVVTLPVMVALAIIVKLDSSGPALFCQRRLGVDGRPFTFYKFRTMVADARERYPELYDYRYSAEQIPVLYFKLADDPRLSRFGKVLRRTSLDELPNLWNVLRGEMSLVGPRPEIPEMLHNYSPRQLAKFSVKPGLTGLAQVGGRNILSFQETVTKDLDYVSRQSMTTDLKILATTPFVVLKMFGAL
jgi:lipopolysaccharide/colanic/teichoic acid biosynthesis glycosyltransferase